MISAFKAYGNSMWPSVKNGSILLVKDKKFENIKCGEIIVYEIKGNYYSHMVISKSSNGVLAGDNFKILKHYVSQDSICGVVVFDHKCGKVINSFISTLYIFYKVLKHLLKLQ